MGARGEEPGLLNLAMRSFREPETARGLSVAPGEEERDEPWGGLREEGGMSDLLSAEVDHALIHIFVNLSGPEWSGSTIGSLRLSARESQGG